MRILITLCARGGSKGIPKKNIKLLNGIPLIGYSIQVAERFKKHVENFAEVDIDLSTDSEEIKEVARQQGLSTNYTRPDVMANDTAGKIDSIYELKNFNEAKHGVSYDYVLDLDVTSPLRTLQDLLDAFQIIQDNEEAYNLFSVNPAARNPYFNMVEQNENGFYNVCKKLDSNVLSRQAAPKVYELNASFYFYKKSFFEQNFKSVYSGKSLIYEMPHLCFDLDHLIDFEFMEYLLSNNKLGFEI